MVKERKRKREGSDCNTSEGLHREGVKRDRLSPPSEATSADEYVLWLVRKPANVSFDELSALKFPSKAERYSETLNRHGTDGALLHCEFEPARTQMLHVPMNCMRSQKDALRLKAVNELCGTVFVTEILATGDQQAVDPQTEATEVVDGVENGYDEGATDTFTFEIHSIRKKPKLPLEGVRERVKAFGLVPKKKTDKLPNLSTNI